MKCTDLKFMWLNWTNCIHLCDWHIHQDKHFQHSEPSLLVLPSQFPGLPRRKHHRLVFLVLELHKNGTIMECAPFSSSFTLHNIFGYINVVACVSSLFLLLLSILLSEHTTICLSILLLIDSCAFSRFQVLWIQLLWAFLCKPFYAYVFFSFG